jgi:hypothetical protein
MVSVKQAGTRAGYGGLLLAVALLSGFSFGCGYWFGGSSCRTLALLLDSVCSEASGHQIGGEGQHGLVAILADLVALSGQFKKPFLQSAPYYLMAADLFSGRADDREHGVLVREVGDEGYVNFSVLVSQGHSIANYKVVEDTDEKPQLAYFMPDRSSVPLPKRIFRLRRIPNVFFELVLQGHGLLNVQHNHKISAFWIFNPNFRTLTINAYAYPFECSGAFGIKENPRVSADLAGYRMGLDYELTDFLHCQSPVRQFNMAANSAVLAEPSNLHAIQCTATAHFSAQPGRLVNGGFPKSEGVKA